MASLVVDAFLVVATAKKPLEEYRFAREMISNGWHWNIVEATGIATAINFVSLLAVMID
jgi:hypothetical protein